MEVILISILIVVVGFVALGFDFPIILEYIKDVQDSGLHY